MRSGSCLILSLALLGCEPVLTPAGRRIQPLEAPPSECHELGAVEGGGYRSGRLNWIVERNQAAELGASHVHFDGERKPLAYRCPASPGVRQEQALEQRGKNQLRTWMATNALLIAHCLHESIPAEERYQPTRETYASAVHSMSAYLFWGGFWGEHTLEVEVRVSNPDDEHPTATVSVRHDPEHFGFDRACLYLRGVPIQ